MTTINYRAFFEAQQLYFTYGYQVIDVPWIISDIVHKATVPFSSTDNRYHDNKLPDGHLVGSAEQGFLELIKQNRLNYGCYQSISPCFRSEDVYDELHCRYFLKLELINYINNKTTNKDSLKNCQIGLLNHAMIFFSSYFNKSNLKISQTDDENTIDIIHIPTQIELGSYGIRKIDNDFYICGTGLAEPRFSVCRLRNSQLLHQQRIKKHDSKKRH